MVITEAAGRGAEGETEKDEKRREGEGREDLLVDGDALLRLFIARMESSVATDGSIIPGGVSLAKGAWDCDAKKPIPPEDEARVFEEVPSMEHSFEGIPTIGPKKDLRHMAWYCNGTRYRMEAYPDWLVSKCKEGLFKGGIRRSNKPSSNTRGISSWTDIALIYAGQEMENDKPLDHYNVPPGCCVMIAMEKEKLNLKKPDPDSAYWN